VIALKAVLLNLLSVVAALGAAVLVFQDGLGPGRQLGGLFPTVLMIAFCAVFGVSMDYEVFLVGRIAEARRAGHADREAIVEGAGRSAGVITGAAAIMSSVFLAFAMAEIASLQQFGAGLTFAIALDATVIRLILLPAIMRALGPWSWWLPRWLARLLPDGERAAAEAPAKPPLEPADSAPPRVEPRPAARERRPAPATAAGPTGAPRRRGNRSARPLSGASRR
jgi:RND superfamily putative drug exporter